MIVTRQRPKKKFNPRKFILPVVAIAAFAFAFWWPPSQKMIRGVFVSGPVVAVANRITAFFAPYLAPLHFAAQEQVIADRNRQIEALSGNLEGQRKDLAAKDTQISGLQTQIRQLQDAYAKLAQATSAPAPVVRTASGNVEPATPQPTTDDPKHAAAIWASMDPAQAAAVAQKLPPDYTAKVMALMDSDSAGALLGALPPTYAAKVARVSVPVTQ
ncbi:MAG: MotE family protein [Vulcanimicrobiaceae bacterium]